MADPSRRWQYVAGVSGAVTVPDGASVLNITAHSTAGGSIVIGDGQTITLPANSSFDVEIPEDGLICAKADGPRGQESLLKTTKTIVFTTTDAYMVAWVV